MTAGIQQLHCCHSIGSRKIGGGSVGRLVGVVVKTIGDGFKF